MRIYTAKKLIKIALEAAFLSVTLMMLCVNTANAALKDYSFPQYGMKSIRVDNSYVVVSEDGNQNTELVSEEVINAAEQMLKETPTCLYAIEPDLRYEFGLTPFNYGKRINLSKCSEQEISELIAYLKEVFEGEGVEISPKLIKVDGRPFIEFSYSASKNEDILIFFDGSFYYSIHDYVKLWIPTEELKLKEFVRKAVIDEIKEEDEVGVENLHELENNSPEMRKQRAYVNVIKIIYYIFVCLLCGVAVFCIVLLIIDFAVDKIITNSEIGYNGSAKIYYGMKTSDRTKRRLGWYHFCMFFRFPLGLITATLPVIVCYITKSSYLNTGVVPILADAIAAGLSIVFYIVSLFKRRSSFLALLGLAVAESLALANTVAGSEYRGFWTIPLYVFCILLWLVPHLIYYIHRSNIWLGDIERHKEKPTISINDFEFNDVDFSSNEKNEMSHDIKNTVKKQEEDKIDLSNEPVEYTVPQREFVNDAKSNGDLYTLSESDVEQIKKWKELYDSGIITEDEYLQKKKAILHL